AASDERGIPKAVGAGRLPIRANHTNVGPKDRAGDNQIWRQRRRRPPRLDPLGARHQCFGFAGTLNAVRMGWARASFGTSDHRSAVSRGVDSSRWGSTGRCNRYQPKGTNRYCIALTPLSPAWKRGGGREPTVYDQRNTAPPPAFPA